MAPTPPPPPPPSRRARLLAELERSAKALRELAQEDEPKSPRSRGATGDDADFTAGIPALVALLRPGGPAAADAAWALAQLTSGSRCPRLGPSNKGAIRDAGGIPPLVSLLHGNGSSSKAAEAASAALTNIASHSPATLNAILGAVLAARLPSLDPFPYLAATIRPAAVRRMQRAAKGMDAMMLADCINDAAAIGADAGSLVAARLKLKKIEEVQGSAPSEAAERERERREKLGIGRLEVPRRALHASSMRGGITRTLHAKPHATCRRTPAPRARARSARAVRAHVHARTGAS